MLTFLLFSTPFSHIFAGALDLLPAADPVDPCVWVGAVRGGVFGALWLR